MTRKLALFFDGTWNQQKDDTNVRRLYQLTRSHRSYRGKLGTEAEEKGATDPGAEHQIKYYHPGVGVAWGEKLRGGILGYGLSRNIKDGYLWLAEHFQPGDDLYFFGFSRGAYTARSLVGLMRKCGILRTPSEALVKQAYHIYREKEWEPDGREAAAFRKTFSWPDLRVKFIGVWDTVGALGIPVHGVWFSSDYYKWHDTDLSKIVENAYHALALDEHRGDFAATVWSNTKRPTPGQQVEQRWFPGAHADVGGGYLRGTLYQQPLRWMQEKAEGAGLQFTHPVKVAAEAYLGPMHDSFREFAWGLYARLPWEYPLVRPLTLGVNETIDSSIWQRVASPEGQDERGNRYFPIQLRGLPNGQEQLGS